MEQKFLFARHINITVEQWGVVFLLRFFWFVIALALFVIFMPGMRPV